MVEHCHHDDHFHVLRLVMPELGPTPARVLRAELRDQLLRAADALANEQCADVEALALTRNTTAAVLAAVDTVATSPFFARGWAA